MALTYVQKMVLVVVAVGLLLAIPLYVIAPMAFQRTVTQDRRITNIEGREERYITTVESVLATPSSYADVAVNFDYYYRKAEHSVRLVVTLPDGYPQAAAYPGTSDSSSVTALAVLPLFAMTLDERSDQQPGTYLVQAVGVYGYVGDSVSYLVMSLENSNATDPQGTWALSSDNGAITDANIYLGQQECYYNFNSTHCFADKIGELVYMLTAPVDLAAWGAQYDALD